ncbi:MAG: polymerase [Leptospiraceae bacterium]|nr:polymerase [Leptospiraceae bacterium]
MDRLKAALIGSEEDIPDLVKDRVEVVGLSIASCLNRAATHLGKDLSHLDYEILERGKQSFLNPKPFRILVSVLAPQHQFADLEEFSMKLGVGDRLLSEDLDQYVTPKHRDGRALVKVYKSGIYVIVFPPLGDGRPVGEEEAMMKLEKRGVMSFDQRGVQKAIKDQKGEPIKIGNYIARPEADSTCKVEITPDEMKAYVKITPPKPGGRDLEVQDVVNALKSHGVVIGFNEDEIKKALDDEMYMQEILAAQGQPAKHGKDAYIDYKVNIKKDFQLEEDEAGKVDFKQMHLVENVVVGQILAEKVPAERGVAGRTLLNRIVEARDGKDVELRQGRNTILSEDRMRLTAEINGQVVFSSGKISVEPVYRVVGDVGPKTGNIMFLGSVVIGGNVLDNYEVKAAGNVEIGGSVQKARIEAEGDVVVQAGILGREEAHIESTGGSVYAKFIQNATVVVTGDVVVQEGILHSNVEAGGKIICNGRRAQIVGGNIRATKEVRARTIGSQAYTATEITVGTDPRILSQHEELSKMLQESEEQLRKGQKTMATLQARKKADPEGFGLEQESKLEENEKEVSQLQEKCSELKEELGRLDEHMEELGAEGKVHAERELHPGVVVTIRNAAQNISDTYNGVTLTYDNGYVKIGKLEKDLESSSRYNRRR